MHFKQFNSLLHNRQHKSFRITEAGAEFQREAEVLYECFNEKHFEYFVVDFIWN